MLVTGKARCESFGSDFQQQHSAFMFQLVLPLCCPAVAAFMTTGAGVIADIFPPEVRAAGAAAKQRQHQQQQQQSR